MSLGGEIMEEFYEDGILPPLKEKLRKAKEYCKHLVYLLTMDGSRSYYYEGKTYDIKEISDFIEKE